MVRLNSPSCRYISPECCWHHRCTDTACALCPVQVYLRVLQQRRRLQYMAAAAECAHPCGVHVCSCSGGSIKRSLHDDAAAGCVWFLASGRAACWCGCCVPCCVGCVHLVWGEGCDEPSAAAEEGEGRQAGLSDKSDVTLLMTASLVGQLGTQTGSGCVTPTCWGRLCVFHTSDHETGCV